MAQTSSTRSYEDFQPSSKWLREEGNDTFVVNLPGFKRDQVKVQIDSQDNVKVTGERPLGDNTWSRFRKDFLIPKNCNDKEIKARFADGVLYIILPKSITQVSTPVQKTETGQKSEKVNGDATEQQQGKSTQAGQKAAEDARKEMNDIDGKQAGPEPSNVGKMIGSMENQEPAAFPTKQTSYRFGIGMNFGCKGSKRAIVNAAVAIAVAVALGLYAKYRFQHSTVEAEAN
ncbi:hypothetical protein NE237_008567 [Protea cynaroides]|uniref:SHSP domain-containing protein n=1 Tax=Protea cynaroides TaxID=273540 RepID=A0A9Q0QZT2_9MAGN|nr:hypothetical protein NE237_008567 [Protea cynaroides]